MAAGARATWFGDDLGTMRDEMASWDDARLVDRYLHGMCGPLALAVHERTGWPTFGIFDAPGGAWTDKPRHVACRAPDGTYADARGTGLDEEAFLSAYRRPGAVPLEVRPFPPAEVRAMFRSRTAADFALAAEHLPRLLPGLPGPDAPAEGAFPSP